MSVKSLPDMLSATYATLSGKLPEKLLAPKVGIVCGSGLSTLADSLREVVLVPYSELEGFGKSTGAHIFLIDAQSFITDVRLDGVVPGHRSTLAFGLMGPGEGVPVVAMLGRVRSLVTLTYTKGRRYLINDWPASSIRMKDIHLQL